MKLTHVQPALKPPRVDTTAVAFDEKTRAVVCEGNLLALGDATTLDVGFEYRDITGRDVNDRPDTWTAVPAGTRTLAYDSASGQLQTETYGSTGLLAGTAISRSFDSLYRLGRLASSVGATSLTSTSYAYDVASRLSTVTNGTATATYSYVANSPLVQSIAFAASGNTRLTTTKTYDNLNRLASIVNAYTASATGLSHTYTYDSANQRTRATREDSTYWGYTYDALGQVTSGSKALADGTPALGLAFAYSFDDIGNRKSATANTQTATYTPNLLNQYTQRTVPPVVDVLGAALTGVPVAVSAGSYAALATRQGEAFFHQMPVDNSAFDQSVSVHVAAEQNPTGNALAASLQRLALLPKTPETFTYDADGNLTGDAHWTYTWDGENRLVRMTARLSALRAEHRARQLDFVYDSQGRRVQKVSTAASPIGVALRATYYDQPLFTNGIVAYEDFGTFDFNRWGWHPVRSTAFAGYSGRWDGTIQVPTSGTWTLKLEETAGRNYRLWVDGQLKVDQWTTLSDGSSQTVTLTLAAGADHALRIDFSEPIGVNNPSVMRLKWTGPGVAEQLVPAAWFNQPAGTYDPAPVATRFLYDGWNLLAELDGSGAPVRTYAWGLDLSGSMQGAGGVGGLVALTDLSTLNNQPSTHFPAFDGNGNGSGLVQASDGSLSAKYDYNAFGETVGIEGAMANGNPFRFSTKYTDNESGHIYYGYRCYDPSTGRWLSRDPIGEEGGLNIYGMVDNDPISSVDCLGLFDSPVVHGGIMSDALHGQFSDEHIQRLIAGSNGIDLGDYIRYKMNKPYNLMIHFDGIQDPQQLNANWADVNRRMGELAQKIAEQYCANRTRAYVDALLHNYGGILHSVQDFYAHSNFVEQFDGLYDPNNPAHQNVTSGMTLNLESVPPALRHGGHNPNDPGMNKDSPGRPNFDRARTAAIGATQQNWQQMQEEIRRRHAQLKSDGKCCVEIEEILKWFTGR